MSFDVYVATRRPVDDDLTTMLAQGAGLVFQGSLRPEQEARIQRPGDLADGFDVVELPREEHANLPARLAELVPDPGWMGIGRTAYGSSMYQELADFCVALARHADGVVYDPQGDQLLWPEDLPRHLWAERSVAGLLMRARGWAEALRQRVLR